MTTFVNVFDQLASIALVVRKAPSTLLRRAYVKAYRDWSWKSGGPSSILLMAAAAPVPAPSDSRR